MASHSHSQPIARSTPQSPALASPWTLAGLALVALGVLGWYSFGPDLRRYIKMSRM